VSQNSQSPTVQPLLTKEQLGRILSARRSITSEEAYQEMAAHLKRPLLPGRKLTFVNGHAVWACC
jgi:hypothetical protein